MKLEQINKQVVFKENTHQYFLNEKELTSVSRLIDCYKSKFDPSGHILRAIAKRDNLTKSQVEEKWLQAKMDGLKRGKSFHRQIEHFIKTGEILDDDYKDVVERYRLIKPTNGNLFCEIPLHNEEYSIAGTADLILLLNDKECELFDWKTNKKIDFKSKYGNKLLYPLNNLDDCEINSYGIQLNLYKFMLEQFGFKVKKITLFHINPETKEIDSYKISNMQNEVKKLLKHYKTMREW
jgi:hypothetical protein